MTDISVVSVDRLDLSFSQRPWPFASERRAEIDTHFAEQRREKPELWNGRVLLLRDFAIAGGCSTAAISKPDFASFLAWRDWDFPDTTVKNSFAMGALRGSDGGFVLGVMAPHTANAGKIYFPAGTPDPNDIVNGTVDLVGSVIREVQEETGLTPADFLAEPGWISILAGPRIAQMKILNTPVPAADLRARILDHIAKETQPELAGVHVVHGPADLDPLMPPFMTAFLADIWN